MQTSKIGIIGCGPVGATLAIMLAQQGYIVDVYEKRPDPTVGPVEAGRSVNLALARRAIRAFEMIGATERVLKNTIKMFGRTSHVNDQMFYT
jgi:kynurenine 3-monooxygenase